MKNLPPIITEAFHLASQTRDRAYSPYSKLNVGAALKVVGEDRLLAGCNVENASFGATICAERFAIGQAVALFGPSEFEFLVLTSTSPAGLIPPCGMCLQVLREFVGPDFPIYLGDAAGIREKAVFSDFFAKTFSSKMLPGPTS